MIEARIDRDRNEQNEQDQGVHDVVIEIVVREAYFVTKPRVGHDELGADDADEGVSDRQFGAGEQIGRGIGEAYAADRLDRPEPQNARGLAQHGWNAVEARQSAY